MAARKTRSSRASGSRKSSSRTTTRSAAARRRSPRTSARRRSGFQIALPRSLPVRPSVALLCVGGLFIAWQLIGIPLFPGAGKWISGQMAGASGVLLIVGGLVVLGLEASGLRESDRADTPSRSSRTARAPRKPQSED